MTAEYVVLGAAGAIKVAEGFALRPLVAQVGGPLSRVTPGPRWTVLIDALEEAGAGVGGREPHRVARELLRPVSVLHNQQGVRRNAAAVRRL